MFLHENMDYLSNYYLANLFYLFFLLTHLVLHNMNSLILYVNIDLVTHIYFLKYSKLLMIFYSHNPSLKYHILFHSPLPFPQQYLSFLYTQLNLLKLKPTYLYLVFLYNYFFEKIYYVPIQQPMHLYQQH